MSHEKALSTTSLKLFFDESGKKQRPNLMAGLLIPTTVYNSPDLAQYTQMLRDNNAPIHDNQSKGLVEKNELTVNLLRQERFYKFLSNLKYYEWNNTKELKEVNFEDYLKLFISNNCARFF